MDDVIIWDDPPMKPITPESQDRIKAWFDGLVAEGKIKVLTVEREYGRVTYITTEEVPRDDREGE